MRTPSLHRRTALAGVAVVATMIVAVDVFVFLSLRARLLADVTDAVDTRVDLVNEVATAFGSEGFAKRLDDLGVPARIPTDTGIVTVGPSLIDEPTVSRDVEVPGIGTVTVLASRQEADTTLRHLLELEAIATLFALGLSVLLFRASTRAALQPLDDVVTVARRTAGGHTGERLRPDRPDTELGRLGVAFDEMLEALESALEEARAAEHRSRRFLADAAHQLRTPTSGIRLSAENLLHSVDEPDRDRSLANLLREAHRMSRLVDALLRVARLDRGAPVVGAPVDVAALIEEEVDRARGLAPGLEISLHGPRSVTVQGDAEALEEAVANLLDNARRHAERRIDATIDVGTDVVEVTIADDGPGLRDEQVERAFERFVSLDGRGGSGLGLPIARGVARAHGGTLDYVRDRFVLRLPMGSREAPAADGPSGRQADDGDGGDQRQRAHEVHR